MSVSAVNNLVKEQVPIAVVLSGREYLLVPGGTNE